jgi:hypothetical protein
MALQHAEAPLIMSRSVLVPIVKNSKKSLNDGNNYRSIEISSVIGKIFDNNVLVNEVSTHPAAGSLALEVYSRLPGV